MMCVMRNGKESDGETVMHVVCLFLTSRAAVIRLTKRSNSCCKGDLMENGSDVEMHFITEIERQHCENTAALHPAAQPAEDA